MGSERTVAVGWTSAILDATLGDPAEREVVLRRAGVGPETYTNPENRISAEQDTAVWQELVRGRPGGIGLDFAEHHLTTSALGLLGFLAQSCHDLREAIEVGVRYHGLVEDAPTNFILDDGDGVTVAYEPEIQPALPEIAEACIATYVALTRQHTSATFSPRAVYFRHPRPQHASAHDAFFRCRVHFGAAHNAMAIARDDLDRPLQGANDELRAYLEGLARRRLGRLPGESTLPAQVRSALDSSFARSPPDIARVSRRMGVSVRTLQRHLKRHGLIFQQLVDEVRFRRALALLDDSPLSISEISETLGFSEPRGFRRAFRRWSGISPQSYRSRPN